MNLFSVHLAAQGLVSIHIDPRGIDEQNRWGVTTGKHLFQSTSIHAGSMNAKTP